MRSFRPFPLLVSLPFIFVLLGLPHFTCAQISLAVPASAFETFDGMGATSSLPTDWRMFKGAAATWAGAVNTVSQVGPCGGAFTTGGSYNFGATGGADRCAGAMTSGTYTSPNRLIAYYQNNGSNPIVQLSVSYKAERYRVNTATASIQFFYSLDGSTWTSVAAGDVAAASFPTGASSYGCPNLAVGAGPFTITGLNVSVGGSIYLGWQIKNTGSSNSQAIGIDDVNVTPADCATPDAIRFVQQPPPSIAQNSIMSPSVTVEAYCSSTGVRATSYTGNITLTLMNGCGTSAVTVAAVGGLATFSSLAVSRSPQSALYFTASAAGFTSVNSSTFNVTSPVGSPVYTTLKNENFDGGTPTWSYVTGSVVTYGSSGTVGSDLTGLVNPTGTNTYLRKSYSANNGSGGYGSTNTMTFNLASGLAAYNDVVFSFQLASLNINGLPVNSGGSDGSGNDNNEDLIVMTELNNSGIWNTLLTHKGFSNKLFPFSSATPDLLAYNANQVYTSSSTQSAIQVTLPSGTTDFRFRVTANNNRSEENWCIDNIQLIGINYPAGVPFPLPVADAGNDLKICPGGNAQLSVSVQNSNGSLVYAWTPAATLSSGTIQNPVATPLATTNYNVTVTDADGCSASDVVQVSILSGGSGIWTGDYDDDWFNCKNWADGVVPGITTDVLISSSATNNANVNYTSPFSGGANALCRNLQITGKTLIVEGSSLNRIEVHGNFTLSGTGMLDMDDGNSGTADGNMFLYGDWTNLLNESQFLEGNGKVTFSGSVNQTLSSSVSGNESFYFIEMKCLRLVLVSKMTIDVSGSATFTNGIIDALSNNQEMVFSRNALSIGASSSGFVEGWVRKIGDNAFTFPVGLDPWGYRPIGISAPSSPTDEYLAQYIRASAAALGPISAIGLNHVSACEYWYLQQPVGASVVNVTASWDNTSCGVTSLPDLVIAHFDGSTWDRFGGMGTATGSLSSGTLTWAGVTDFNIFTLGSITSQNPLPVKLLYFSAEKLNTHEVLCTWQTQTEINCDHFDVEVSRGKSPLSFESIGSVNGAGTSSGPRSYSFVDWNPVKGINYYRLRQVDFDGYSSYTKIIALNFLSAESFQLHSVFPNPFEKDPLLQWETGHAGDMDISVFNSIGEKIYGYSGAMNGGSHLFTLPLEENLPSGIYFVQLTFDGESQSIKLLKE